MRSRPIDVSEIVRRMAEGEQEQSKSRPLPEAQAMELRSVLDCYLATPERQFAPGDFVKDKNGLALLRDHDGIVQMFWRWLNDADWFDKRIIEEDFSSAVPSKPDCLIAYQTDGHTVFIARDSKALMLRDVADISP